MIAIALTLTMCYLVGCGVSTYLLARREWKLSMRRHPVLYERDNGWPRYNPDHPVFDDYTLAAIPSIFWPIGFPIAWMMPPT